MLHDPTFWVLVSFLVFIVLAIKPMRKSVLSALDQRAARIKAQLEEAQKLREDAQKLLAEYQQKQRQAMADIQGILAHAREEAARHRRQGEQALEASLQRRERQALDRIAQAETQALNDVRQAAADVAITATRQLLQSALDSSKRSAMIDAAIKELPQKIH
ncbi:MAG: F0F1 ATP synthase subunit B [Alphaproteobacteria bacterium]